MNPGMLGTGYEVLEKYMEVSWNECSRVNLLLVLEFLIVRLFPAFSIMSDHMSRYH